MKRIDPIRLLSRAGLLALVLLYAILWARMFTDHEQRTGSDFISAYTAGIVAQRWGGEQVYDLALQQSVQEEVVGFELAPGQVLMFNHPPFLVPLLAALMDDDYPASLARYALFMMAVYAGTLVLAGHLLRQDGLGRNETALALAGMATFFPLFVSLLNTQDTALVLLGAFLGLTGVLTQRPWLAGLGLALTSVRPHVTLVLALPFLFRQRRVFLWFGFGMAILGLVSLLAVGKSGLLSYPRILLSSAGGKFYGMQEAAMVNLIGLLWRIAPGLGGSVIRWIGWGVYGATLVGLCLFWKRTAQIGERQMALATLLAVFTVPHLHYHDLTLLLLPLLVFMRAAAHTGKWPGRLVALIPLATSYFFLFGSLVPGLKYQVPYVLMVGVGLFLAWPERFATFFSAYNQKPISEREKPTR